MGKTQLALEYAFRHKDEYEIVWWFTAEDSVSLTADIVELGSKLGLPLQELDQPQQVQTTLQHLAHIDRRWLLIYDNADNISADELSFYLPRDGAGHVLITTRNPSYSSKAVVLKLDVFAREESVAFLLKRTGRDEKEAADALADALGDLPLALEHAAAYVETTEGTIARYLNLFATQREALFALATEPEDYDATIMTTWQLAFERLRESSPDAIVLFNLLCFLAPDAVLLDPLAEAVASAGVSDDIAAVLVQPIARDQAIAALRRYSLVVRDMVTEGDTLQMHRLVQAVGRNKMGAERRKKWAALAVALLNATFPSDRSALYEWEAGPRLVSHALVAADLALREEADLVGAARLLDKAAYYLRLRASYSQARPYQERALALREQELGSEHPETAESLDHLGVLLRAMGEREQAYDYLMRGLAIRERVLGPNHPDTAESLYRLGSLLRLTGQLVAARDYAERALNIREKVLGPNHPDTSQSLNSVGHILSAIGDRETARSYYERALSIRESVLGSDHPETAQSLNNVGYVLRLTGQLNVALTYYERALEIRERTLGPDHPETARSLNNLGFLLGKLGDADAALAHYERAHEIRERKLGPQHPETAQSLNNLAMLLRQMEEPEAASDYLRRSLAIKEQTLGPKHTGTARSINNLGLFLSDLGETEAARQHLERALAIRVEVLGHDHPDTARSLKNLGILLGRTGNFKEAQQHLEQALSILKASFGSEHPDTAATFFELGKLSEETGDLTAAHDHYQQALSIYTTVFGLEHPAIRKVREALQKLQEL